MVGKYLGQLALTLAVLTLPPLGVALAYGEYALALRFVPVIGLLAAGGAPLARLPAPERLQANEALVIVALAFVLTPAAMIWPMMGAGLSPVDAWFEAVSGVTTTGLTTLASVSHRPHGFLFARAWLQWYGGLGIVVLSVALLMNHQAASRRLVEVTGADTLVTTTRIHARRVLVVYLSITAAGAVALMAGGVNPFTGVTHALSAVSTGGFSTFDNSLAGLAAPSARWILMTVALMGAVSLPLYYRIWHGGWRVAAADAELRALLIGCAAVSAALTGILLEGAGRAPGATAVQAVLLGVSAQTTTGFTTLSVPHLPEAAKALLLLAMAVGGSVGSTAGGIKLLRVLSFLQLLRVTVRRTAMPAHAVAPARLGGHRLEQDDLLRALLLICLFAVVIVLSWLPFVALGYPALDALFEVVSATATVGLSAGITGPHLPTGLKLLLSLDMLLGRLEIIALLVVVFPATWRGKRTPSG